MLPRDCPIPDARPRPDLAIMVMRSRPSAPGAHNPKIAPLAEQAGFDLQLSGHTHAGQFFPWTFVIHLVHGPPGLSRQRPLVGLRQCRHGDMGSARAPRHETGADPPAPRGRERNAPPLVGGGLLQVGGVRGTFAVRDTKVPTSDREMGAASASLVVEGAVARLTLERPAGSTP